MPSPNGTRRRGGRFNIPRYHFDLLGSPDPILSLPPQPPSAEGLTFINIASTWGMPPSSNSTEASQPSESTPRRRGWARLDLDGNEIPSDEEEEYERLHAERRKRATRRAFVLASAAQAAGVQPSPPTPPPQELTIYHSINPHVVLRHNPQPSYPANFINPLPMPLDEMVESKKSSVKYKPTLLLQPIVAGF